MDATPNYGGDSGHQRQQKRVPAAMATTDRWSVGPARQVGPAALAGAGGVMRLPPAMAAARWRWRRSAATAVYRRHMPPDLVGGLGGNTATLLAAATAASGRRNNYNYGYAGVSSLAVTA